MASSGVETRLTALGARQSSTEEAATPRERKRSGCHAAIVPGTWSGVARLKTFTISKKSQACVLVSRENGF